LIAPSPDSCPSPRPSPRKNGEREETAAALAAHGSGARLELRALSKAFGTAKAIDQVSLQIPAGAFVSLLGPSGSGKTTMLNLIAGFLSADSGEILLDGASISAVPPHKRNIGMVFQSYSLFPHMSVAENVRFPLRMRSALSRSAARERVNEMLTLVQLAHLGARYPRQLSGGQQQRVAMARALVSRPRLLLMDEPLGALDKKLREQMQIEIRRIHKSVGTTVLYVTHDQAEALSMSDVVAVMHQGRIAQIGPPRLLYEAPADVFVADFLGDSNLLAGTYLRAAGDAATVELPSGEVIDAVQGTVAANPGDAVVVLIRPEDIAIDWAPQAAESRNTVTATLRDIAYHGDTFKLEALVGSTAMTVKVARAHALRLAPGQQISLSWKSTSARLLANGKS
jgi:putative spermidine/putrescine transport system ATP-binding protein